MIGNLSKDLTLVLIRGNSAPRTFKFKLPGLRRNLFLISTIFVLLLSCSFIFSGIFVYERFIRDAPPVLTEDMAEKLDNVAVLESEISTLQLKLENRKSLVNTTSDKVVNSPISLLSEVSTLQDDQSIEVSSFRITRIEDKDDLRISFDIHNKLSEKTPARGRIIILAKTEKRIAAYPSGVFSPNENILVNFSKGESFGISRFRSVMANFRNFASSAEKVSFQILIFSFTGKILKSINIQEGEIQ